MRSASAAVAIAALAGSAHANVVNLVIFEVIATDVDTGVSQSQTFTIDPGADAGGNIDWVLDSPVDFSGIGGLTQASVSVRTSSNRGVGGGQSVVADFSVFAATQNAAFQINSAVVSFGAIPAASAQGFASAAIAVNDVQGNGATLTPGAGGGYNAIINGDTVSPFATLFPAGSPLSAGNFSQDTGSFLPAGVDVSSISANWSFSLSGLDSAIGTSTFTVIPAPAPAALLALGGLAAARRRR